MVHKNINIGDKVVYIPKHLLMTKKVTILDKNLGVVTSKNDDYIFVRYKGDEHSQATSAIDLYSIENRSDLINQLKQ